MNFVAQAMEFISEGFNPLPLRQDKTPALEQGHNFLYKPVDRVDARFKNCALIGIACGTVSDGFYCIDFDKHGGQEIDHVFKEFTGNELVKWLFKQGKLTYFKTPSGGYHCYYRHRTEHKGNGFAWWMNGDVMIEVRGNGQYVATYPSAGYQKLKGVEISKLDYLEPNELEQIQQLLFSFSKIHRSYKNPNEPERKWPEKWDESTPTGYYNENNVEDAKKILLDKGWKFLRIRKHDKVELWQRPGKDGNMHSATFGQFRKMFYVFSESASPFESNKGYAPFDIYKLLKFDGDWRKAIDSLKPKLKVVQPEPEPEPKAHNFFPIEVFPDFIRKYILELNRTLNFHVDFSSAAAMFTIATINGNKYKLRVKNGWEAPTIFWFACVGYPGTIKTHPVKTITRPLIHLDIASKSNYDEEMRHYNPEQKQPKPRFKQILISDYTLEALHSIHDINKRGVGLYKDELKGFLNDMNKYRKGSDEEFWLESFNNGSYIVNRVTKEPVMINNICINIIGTIQHDVLNKVVTEYAGNGLIDRFLFTASESKVYNISDNEIEDKFFEYWNNLIKETSFYFQYQDQDSTEVIEMTKGAFRVYQEIDSEYVNIQNNEDQNQDIKNYLSKMKTYVPRFALLLSIMEGICDGSPIEVDETHMRNAKKIADYFVSTASNLYQTHGVSVDIREAESVMRGVRRVDKIIKLYQAGFRQSDISKYYGISKQAVSKIILSTKSTEK